MSEEILINVTPQETRVAIVENGAVQDVYIERSRSRGIVGNIYKGRVNRVLPGMEAAFVDIGLDKAAFLHLKDVVVHESGKDDTEKRPSITELLHEGQKLLIQVIKDPLGTKGARVTTHITVPSRYLVYMPNASSVGVSSKIDNEEERFRLRELVAECMAEDEMGGYIARTASEGASHDALANDVKFLCKLWSSIRDDEAAVKPGEAVYKDLPLALRALRDMAGPNLEKVRVDSRETYQSLTEFAKRYVPETLDKIEHYPGNQPISDLYNLDDEIKKALERKVMLKSGGYLVIDQTEAMTTIDVNTGSFVGHRNFEETIFKTNLEASRALARQLRLRNLGGIIIIDYIDMKLEEHKQQVIRALEKALSHDHAKTHVCDVSKLGLVEMTRKRTRESLEHVLCEPCPSCDGRGSYKTAETVCYEIFREIVSESRLYDEAQQLLVLASQDVIDRLLDEESTGLVELEEFINTPIKLQVEQLYTQENYDVVPM
ncbi:MAG: ribonuclease G [Gammaproteobacteria bacterium]|nr:ribonuclease G [Gammaproteobacteria bacterium]